MELAGRVERLEREISRLERLEKGLAYHELVLAKKVSDINRFEQSLERFVHKEHLEEVRKEIRKLAKHEDVIFESNKYIHELLSELSKLRTSQDMLKDRLTTRDDRIRRETGESIAHFKEEIRRLAAKPKEMAEIKERLAQIEYQNKLLMKYLKLLERKSHK